MMKRRKKRRRSKEDKEEERPGVQRVVVYLPPAVMWPRSCHSASLPLPRRCIIALVAAAPRSSYPCIVIPASHVTHSHLRLYTHLPSM